MSRIGKKPIPVPEKVEVSIEGRRVLVKGPKGQVTTQILERAIDATSGDLRFEQSPSGA